VNARNVINARILRPHFRIGRLREIGKSNSVAAYLRSPDSELRVEALHNLLAHARPAAHVTAVFRVQQVEPLHLSSVHACLSEVGGLALRMSFPLLRQLARLDAERHGQAPDANHSIVASGKYDLAPFTVVGFSRRATPCRPPAISSRGLCPLRDLEFGSPPGWRSRELARVFRRGQEFL